MGRHRSEAGVDVEHRRAYAALAEVAARQCGLKPPTATAAAENDQAREIRDCLWAELQRRVGDIATYSVGAIHKWLEDDIGASVGHGSVQRLREYHVANLTGIRLRAERARQFTEAIGASGQSDALEAARGLSAQLMFNALAGLDTNALSNLTDSRILKLFDAVAIMSRQDVETRYRKAQLGELVKKFDREATAKMTAREGKLTAEDLAEIRKAVFGEAGG